MKAGIPKLAIALARAKEFSIRDKISVGFERRGARAEAKGDGRARSVESGSTTRGIAAGVGMRSGMGSRATGRGRGFFRAAAEASILSCSFDNFFSGTAAVCVVLEGEGIGVGTASLAFPAAILAANLLIGGMGTADSC